MLIPNVKASSATVLDPRMLLILWNKYLHLEKAVLTVRLIHLSGYSNRFVYVLLYCIFKTWLPQSVFASKHQKLYFSILIVNCFGNLVISANAEKIWIFDKFCQNKEL
jgi:hypothetical protein